MKDEKSKSGKGDTPVAASLEELLKEAGFQTLETPAPHVIHASGAEDFGKAHAAFLQAAGKHAAFIDSRKFCTVPQPILIVHREAVEVGGQESDVSGDGSGHALPPFSNEEKPDAPPIEQQATNQEQRD